MKIKGIYILILAITIVFFLADTFYPLAFLHPRKWIMLAFFATLAFVYHSLNEQGLNKNGEKFIQFYLSTVTIRLVACIVFVGTFLFIGVDKPKLFLINFFVLYLCFTLFEIISIYCNLRRFS